MKFSIYRKNPRQKAGILWLVLQNLVFSAEDVIGEDLSLHILKAQPGDGVGEALAGLAVFPIEEDGLLDDGQNLLLAGEELAQGRAQKILSINDNPKDT